MVSGRLRFTSANLTMSNDSWIADRPVLLLSHFYEGIVPPTPLQAPSVTDVDHDACPGATRALLLLANRLGKAIGYDREQHGRLIQDIFPIRTREFEQVSTSSRVKLGSHTETAFHPYKPRYVMLMCLRGDPSAATTYAIVDDIVEFLSEDELEILQTDAFVTTVDPSFMTNGESDARVPLTPLTLSPGRSVLVYDELLMSGLTPEAIAALAALHTAVRKATRSVVLQAGEVLVLDNERVVHGRTPFAPRYDGTDRWLKRALVVRELPSESICGRVIQTTL